MQLVPFPLKHGRISLPRHSPPSSPGNTWAVAALWQHIGSTLAAHWQHMGSTQAAHGQHIGSTWAAQRGQHIGNTSAAHWQHMGNTLGSCRKSTARCTMTGERVGQRDGCTPHETSPALLLPHLGQGRSHARVRDIARPLHLEDDFQSLQRADDRPADGAGHAARDEGRSQRLLEVVGEGFYGTRRRRRHNTGGGIDGSWRWRQWWRRRRWQRPDG